MPADGDEQRTPEPSPKSGARRRTRRRAGAAPLEQRGEQTHSLASCARASVRDTERKALKPATWREAQLRKGGVSLQARLRVGALWPPRRAGRPRRPGTRPGPSARQRLSEKTREGAFVSFFTRALLALFVRLWLGPPAWMLLHPTVERFKQDRSSKTALRSSCTTAAQHQHAQERECTAHHRHTKVHKAQHTWHVATSQCAAWASADCTTSPSWLALHPGAPTLRMSKA